MAQRVLVADDDMSFLIRIKVLLGDAGFSVDTVSTLAEAVQRATRGEQYEYVILDQRFPPPSIDGVEAGRQIRQESPNTKVILLTLFGNTQSCHEALDSGIFRYIVRPFDDKALISILTNANAVEDLTRELKSPSLLRNTLDSAGIGISVIDRSYRILYMNDHQRSISHPGCREGGVCWLEYNPNTISRGPCTWCPTEPALDTGNTEVSTTISVVDDRVHYFSVVASPITAPGGGKPIAVIEFVRDITEDFEADQTATQATELATRLKGILAKVCALGFSRARLYELAEDDMLLCRAAFGDDPDPTGMSIPVDGDDYWKETVEAHEPIIHAKRPGRATAYERIPGWQDIDEWIDAPLRPRNADALVGKISVDNKVLHPVPPGEAKPVPRRLSLARKDELTRIAHWAANEIQREREAARVLRESERLRRLRGLSELIASESPMEKDLEDVVRVAKEVTAANGVHLRFRTDDGLKMMAGFGSYYEAANQQRKTVSFADTESGSVQAFNRQNEVVQQDTSRDQALQDFIASQPDSNMRRALASIGSWASFPIIFEGDALGVINLQSNRPKFFGPTVLEAARDFVAMIGPMLRILNLIDELRATKERLLMASKMGAHKINNPNAAIQSRVDLWRDKRGSGFITEQALADLMEGISRDSGRISQIVKDLRRFLQGAKATPPSSPVDPVQVVRQRVSVMLGAWKGVRMVDFLQDGLPLTRLDPVLIADIADELTADACKAMGRSGTYTVVARLANDGEKAERNLAGVFLRFEFSDSGPGVPAEKKEWIFEPFNTTFADGTGLGLAYVRDAVKELGGVIREEGVQDQGARFILMLPVRI